MSTTYYVDQNNPNADDQNPGTAQNPWKTIGKAAEVLESGDTVFVRSGVYRETIEVANSGTLGAYITFAAYPGDSDVIISGTEIVDSPWSSVDGFPCVYCASNWSYSYNSSDQGLLDESRQYLLDGLGSLNFNEGILQQWINEDLNEKQVFLDNQTLLDQVFSLNDMISNTFFVDLADGNKLYIHLGCNSNPRNHLIEVAKRLQIFIIDNKSYIKVQGFTFHRAADTPRLHALLIQNASHIHFKDNVVTQMSGSGINIVNSADITLLNNRINHNGHLGIIANNVTSPLLSGNETSRNCWKWEDIFRQNENASGWESGGIKAVMVKNWTIVNHTAVGNFGNGIWFDCGGPGCSGCHKISGSVVSNNHRTGIRMELAHNVEIAGNHVLNNARQGVSIQADYCKVHHNLIVNNKRNDGVAITASYIDKKNINKEIALGEQVQLDNRIISQNLRDFFNAYLESIHRNKDTPPPTLSNNATVFVDEAGSKWRISDPDQSLEYFIEHLGAALEAYTNLAKGAEVYNNTIVNHRYGIAAYTPAQSKLRNNIITCCSHNGIAITHAANKFVPLIEHNNFFENNEDKDVAYLDWSLVLQEKDERESVLPNLGHTPDKNGNIKCDPKFINSIECDPAFENNIEYDPKSKDFHLQEDSPCIDAGMNVGFPFISSAPDIGAYERFSAPPSPMGPPTETEITVEADPISLILRGQIYATKITLPRPLAIEALQEQVREFVENSNPEEKKQALARVQDFLNYLNVLEQELGEDG